jgi:hypothetical protein
MVQGSQPQLVLKMLKEHHHRSLQRQSGGLDIRTSSNNIVLSDGDGNPRQFINANGYISKFTTDISDAD